MEYLAFCQAVYHQEDVGYYIVEGDHKQWLTSGQKTMHCKYPKLSIAGTEHTMTIILPELPVEGQRVFWDIRCMQDLAYNLVCNHG